MKRCVILLTVTCLLASALAAASSVSMPAFWRYAHPEAKALVGIEWSRVVSSPLGAQFRQKLAESSNAPLPGVELIDQVSRVLISSPGKIAGAPEGKTPAVVAVQGNFNLGKIRELAAGSSTGSTEYRSIEILEKAEEGETPTVLALVDERTLVIGDMESVTAAIDHHIAENSNQAADPLYLRASELAAGNSIWVVAYASPSDFSAESAQKAPFLKDVNSVEAGISLDDGLGIELNLGTETGRGAAELAAGLQLMLGMLMTSSQNQPDMPNFAEKLNIVADQTLVRMSMHLDQNELEQSMREMTSNVMAASFGGNTEDVPLHGKVGGSGDWSWGDQPAQPRPEPREQVIKIYGMEEGTREIPLGQ